MNAIRYILKRKYYATYPVKQNSGKYFPEKEKGPNQEKDKEFRHTKDNINKFG